MWRKPWTGDGKRCRNGCIICWLTQVMETRSFSESDETWSCWAMNSRTVANIEHSADCGLALPNLCDGFACPHTEGTDLTPRLKRLQWYGLRQCACKPRKQRPASSHGIGSLMDALHWNSRPLSSAYRYFHAIFTSIFTATIGPPRRRFRVTFNVGWSFFPTDVLEGLLYCNCNVSACGDNMFNNMWCQ